MCLKLHVNIGNQESFILQSSAGIQRLVSRTTWISHRRRAPVRLRSHVNRYSCQISVAYMRNCADWVVFCGEDFMFPVLDTSFEECRPSSLPIMLFPYHLPK